MPQFSRQARVPYSAEQMFDLVNDVETYPEFLHWCNGSRVESRDGTTVVASLDIGLGGLHQSFRTRNVGARPTPNSDGRIEMELLSGPFKRLHGRWGFKVLAENECEVSLNLDYEFSFSPLAVAFRPLFDEIARTQVDAFITRAAQVYG